MSYREVSEIRDGMRIDWDMPIKMDDGLVLRCDIYRPVKAGKYPVILTYGPYAKWLHFDDLYHEQWQRMCEIHPDVPTGSTNKYQCWEGVDPEKWVPDGYVCIRVDSRGSGRSPGIVDIWSLREAQDLALIRGKTLHQLPDAITEFVGVAGLRNHGTECAHRRDHLDWGCAHCRQPHSHQ